MTGRYMMLNGVSITDATAPKLKVGDPLQLPGVLMLAEANHPDNPIVGVPASGDVLPNLAEKRAVTLTGAAAADLRPTMSSASMSGALGLLERSGKGGLHGIVTQSVGVAGTAEPGASVRIPSAVMTYMAEGAGSGHTYYFSTWGKITRAFITGSGNDLFVQVGRNSGGLKGWFILHTTFIPSPGTGSFSDNANVVGDLYKDVAGLPGEVLASANYPATARILSNWGSGTAASNLAPGINKSKSFVWYRSTIIDLTAAGLTYAQAHALDYAEYVKQVKTVGGRYYSDTYTAPSTIA